MGLALPDVASAAQARSARGLRAGPCNPTSRLLHVMELGRLLTCPRGQQHLVAFVRKADRHAPPRRLSCGAVSPERTGLAGWLSKPDLDARLAFGMLAAMPGDARLALRTGEDLVVPVDVELRDLAGARSMRLPTRVDGHRPNELNGRRVAALNETFGADVAGIDQVLLWQEVLARELRLERLQSVVVLLGRGRRLALGDEVRQVVVAALAQMHRVAAPVEITFSAVAHILVIGRTVPLTDRQHLLGGKAVGAAVDLAILLRPGLLKEADRA